jgi:hypothetical protein
MRYRGVVSLVALAVLAGLTSFTTSAAGQAAADTFLVDVFFHPLYKIALQLMLIL